jgi:hypothetical protein
MSKKFALAILLVTAALTLNSEAQDAARKKKGFFAPGNWQIDLRGGWAAFDPRCLNMFPQYYQKTIPFLTLDYYKYNKQVYGNNYSYTVSPDPKNAFREIANAWPVGVDIRYHVNSRLDVSLGLGYLSRKAKSFYHASISTGAVPPNGYGTWGLDDIDVRDLTYDDFSVSVRSWIPSLGVHYRALSSGVFSGELNGAAGLVFGSFEHTYHQLDRYTFPDGFWFAFENQVLSKGKGVGIALSGGCRLGLRLSSRFELFAGAAYELISVPTLTGSGMQGARYVDVESKPPLFTTTGQTGTWRFYSANFLRNWGLLSADNPVLAAQPSQVPERFDLNLSGLRLQFGISVRL